MRLSYLIITMSVALTTIAPFSASDPAAAVGSCASTYVVRAGDSWSAISHLTGIYIRPLAAANGLTRDSVLHAGMELCVPAADSSNSPHGTAGLTQAPTAVESSPLAPPARGDTTDCGVRHQVERTESWSSIALHHRVDIQSLISANGSTIDTIIHPGDQLCVPLAPAESAPARSAQPGRSNSSASTSSASTSSTSRSSVRPAAEACESAIAGYRRAMCMDLSERRAIIGGRSGTTAEFPAVGGYGTVEDCARTVPGRFAIGNKQAVTARKRLRWGLSFGGGCIGDQIVHTVSRRTMDSATGTGGCIGLLEADAKAAYDILQTGDTLIIID